MNKDAYFQEMKDFSSKVILYISKLINEEINEVNNGLSPVILNYANKRIDVSVPLQKPFLLYLAYRAAGGTEDVKKLIPICAATELLNISSYQANYALDGKNDNTSFDKIKSCFIASMLSRELVNKAILGFANGFYLNGLGNSVYEKLSVSNEKIYQGQFLDISQLTIEKFLNEEITEESFFINYEERCYGLSGNFTENCSVLGGLLAGAEDNVVEALKVFGGNLGIGMHILNDLADNIPISDHKIFIHKSYKDQFSDVRLGKLTLPIYYALKNTDKKNRNFIFSLVGQNEISEEDSLRLYIILEDSSAIKLTKKSIKTYFKIGSKALSKLVDSKEKINLKLMISCLRSNKYYHYLTLLNNKISIE